VTNWRNKQETNLSEVIQIEKIFTNATSGNVASKKDLKVFGDKMTEKEIFMEILNKGEFQVGDLEREA
jgi:ribosome maturation protein SDO1